MKRLVIVAALAALVSACGDDDNGPTGPSNTGPIVFTSQLTAANEVPPVTNAESTCRGTVTITFNVPRDASGAPTGGGTANFAVQLSECPNGTVWTLGHIHTGAAGVNNPPIVNIGLTPATPVTLSNGSTTQSFTNIDISQQNATNVTNNPGGFYFNVHSTLNPGGFARGQLVRQN
jgi:CHRD domain